MRSSTESRARGVGRESDRQDPRVLQIELEPNFDSSPRYLELENEKNG